MNKFLKGTSQGIFVFLFCFFNLIKARTRNLVKNLAQLFLQDKSYCKTSILLCNCLHALFAVVVVVFKRELLFPQDKSAVRRGFSGFQDFFIFYYLFFF